MSNKDSYDTKKGLRCGMLKNAEKAKRRNNTK